MKHLSIIISLMIFPLLIQAQSVEGLWKTVDDETGKVKSIVKVYKENGRLYGKIIEVLVKKPGEVPKCTACTGKMKNKKIEGMTIVNGLNKKNGKWEGKDGILDPESGKVYKCKIWLENKNKLAVRGQIGPIGRTQYWIRTK